MTAELTGQLQALAGYMDEEQGALLIEDLPITKRVRPFVELPSNDRSPIPVKTQNDSKTPVVTARRSKRGPLVAAGVFAGVILLAGSFALFGPDPSPPPASPTAGTAAPTTVTTTAIELPATDPVDVALAFMTAQRDRDADVAMALFTETATIDTWEFDEPGAYESVFALWDAIGFTYVDEECTTGTSSGEVVCRYTKQADWLTTEQQEQATPLTGRLSFVIEDGLITQLTDHSPTIPGRDPFRAFLIGEATDEERATMYVTSDQYMSLTPESIALWDQYTQAFIAARDG